MPLPTHDAVMEALDRVIDPELRRPVTDLGMVSSVDIAEDGVVSVEVLLTVAGCPLKDTITADTRREVGSVEGVTDVQVSLGVMNDVATRDFVRSELRDMLSEILAEERLTREEITEIAEFQEGVDDETGNHPGHPPSR